MELKQFYSELKSFAESCGAKIKTPTDLKGNTILRDNATHNINNADDFKKGAYFGFIREDEDFSGGYHDFSLVFFPQIDNQACIVSLGVGSLGFVNDYDIASLPWVRRLFTRLRKPGHKTYFKNNFADIESPSAGLVYKVKRDYPNLKKVVESYKTFLPASQILDFSDPEDEEENMKMAKQWIATYAEMRGWASNGDHRKVISKILPKPQNVELSENDIYDVLKKDRFIVLQGAPGTGKTYNALEVAKQHFKNVFFEQFHAETTYSDFIYGIRPNLHGNQVGYEATKGVLYEAIEKAEENRGDVLLIIDEINRANLSNVLGPVFYLFEKNQKNHLYGVNIGGGKLLNKLPDNLFVIATMNTADRSLAVVDFALRRRFTWLTLRPHLIKDSDFREKEFNEFNNLFMKYATDDELNLQPGHSYFFAKDDDEMKNRLRYELMPLMKEYFNEGFLSRAKDEFSNYCYDKLGILLYE